MHKVPEAHYKASPFW
jgi:hypothetical protein